LAALDAATPETVTGLLPAMREFVRTHRQLREVHACFVGRMAEAHRDVPEPEDAAAVRERQATFTDLLGRLVGLLKEGERLLARREAGGA
jgi:hypothetical protein